MSQPTAPHVSPLDPDSEGGRAAAEALTDALASIEMSVASRKQAAVRRARRTDKAA